MRLKEIERAWKRLSFQAVYTYLRIRSRNPVLPDWTAGRRRVLVLRPDGIGDAIVTTPLLRSIAAIQPDLQLDVVGSPASAPLLRRLEYLGNVFVFEKRSKGSLLRLARELRKQRYDAVIDPRVIAPSMTGLMLMLAAGAPHRIGVGDRGADPGLTYVVSHRKGHIIDLLAGFSIPFGLEPSEVARRPELPLSGEEHEWGEATWREATRSGTPRRLLVNVSAGEAPRQWPEERFVSVIRSTRASNPDLAVVVIGAPAEWERTQGIATEAGVPSARTPSLGHVTGIVATADVVFTPDTSVVHIASAFRKPTVAMYLDGTARQWGAYGVEGQNIESADRSLTTLPVERVLGALEGVLTSSVQDSGFGSQGG